MLPFSAPFLSSTVADTDLSFAVLRSNPTVTVFTHLWPTSWPSSASSPPLRSVSLLAMCLTKGASD